jgi:hypothetical protein
VRQSVMNKTLIVTCAPYALLVLLAMDGSW